MDGEIAELKRKAETTGDPADRRRWRIALLRAGRGAEAGFEVGDLVEVTCGYERERTWKGRVQITSDSFEVMLYGRSLLVEDSKGGKCVKAAHFEDAMNVPLRWTLLEVGNGD